MKYGEKVDLKKAVWQYLLDHSKVQPNGYLGFLFYVKDEKDLWRRIKYRQTTGFQRYSPDEKIMRQISARKVWAYYRWNQERAKRFDKRTQEILDNGSLIEKLKWKLYKNLKKSLYENTK